MADTSTIQTPADDDQPTSARLHSLQQQVASFFQSASPQQLDALESVLTTQPTSTRLHSLLQQVASFFQSALPQQLDALESFLTTEPVPMGETAGDIIPPAEEARIRLELAQQLQGVIREQLEQENWRFTASHLSVLFVMPIDILREVASSGLVDSGFGGSGAQRALQLASDLAKECKVPSFESLLRPVADDGASSCSLVSGDEAYDSPIEDRKLS
jgi:hypothetical protein